MKLMDLILNPLINIDPSCVRQWQIERGLQKEPGPGCVRSNWFPVPRTQTSQPLILTNDSRPRLSISRQDVSGFPLGQTRSFRVSLTPTCTSLSLWTSESGCLLSHHDVPGCPLGHSVFGLVQYIYLSHRKTARHTFLCLCLSKHLFSLSLTNTYTLSPFLSLTDTISFSLSLTHSLTRPLSLSFLFPSFSLFLSLFSLSLSFSV